VKICAQSHRNGGLIITLNLELLVDGWWYKSWITGIGLHHSVLQRPTKAKGIPAFNLRNAGKL